MANKIKESKKESEMNTGKAFHASTPSFVLSIPFHYEAWQKAKLDSLFKASQQMANCLIAERLKALHEMERTRKWRKTCEDFQAFYQDAPDNTDKWTDEQKNYYENLCNLRKAIMKEYELDISSFQRRIKKYRKHFLQLQTLLKNLPKVLQIPLIKHVLSLL